MSEADSGKNSILKPGLFVILIASVVVVLSLLPLRKEMITGGNMNLLLITLDTVRQDRLGIYSPKHAFTPALDKIAREGVIFDEAISSVPLTFPSHTTMFTGLYPPRTGAHTNYDDVLGEEHTTLAEILNKRGYFTAAVIAATPLTSDKGLNQGFDIYENNGLLGLGGIGKPIMKNISNLGDIPGNIIAQKGIELIQQAEEKYREDDQKFFIWLHFYDAHSPYEPPNMYQILYEDDKYSGEVAFVDSCVDRVIETLRETGLYDKTAVVVIGDHGESLDEHGEPTHGYFLYEATMKVPFFMKAPGVIPPGKRVKSMVRVVDTMPIILEALGVKGYNKSKLDGVSLFPLITGKVDELISETYTEAMSLAESYSWAKVFALRDHQYKFMEMPVEELYDLREDPGETKNLAESLPDIRARMRDRLDTLKHKVGAEEIDLNTTRDDKTSEERERALQALGYVGAGGGRSKGPILPKEIILKAILYINDGRNMMTNGNFEEAINLFEKSLEIDENLNRPVYDLGNIYFSKGELEKAADYFKRYSEMVPRSSRGFTSWGGVLIEMGKYEDAEKVLKVALEINPNSFTALTNLGFVYFTESLYDDAETQFRKALKATPDFGAAHMGLAAVYAFTSREEAAIDELYKAIANDPENYKAYYKLGELMLKIRNNPEAALAAYEKYLSLVPDKDKDVLVEETVEKIRSGLK